MTNVQISGSPMTLPAALSTAVVGYAVVFLGIVLLMAVVILMGKAMTAGHRTAPEEAPAPVSEGKKEQGRAPGTAGELKLYDTDPRTAAMIMAIVAEKTGKPLNELRFKSIREVKQDEI